MQSQDGCSASCNRATVRPVRRAALTPRIVTGRTRPGFVFSSGFAPLSAFLKRSPLRREAFHPVPQGMRAGAGDATGRIKLQGIFYLFCHGNGVTTGASSAHHFAVASPGPPPWLSCLGKQPVWFDRENVPCVGFNIRKRFIMIKANERLREGQRNFEDQIGSCVCPAC